MIVHSKYLDLNLPDDLKRYRKPKLIDFNPLLDPDFKNNLYDWWSYGPQNKEYKLWHGITPGTKNIWNNRWKKKPNFLKGKVSDIEKKL